MGRKLAERAYDSVAGLVYGAWLVIIRIGIIAIRMLAEDEDGCRKLEVKNCGCLSRLVRSL